MAQGPPRERCLSPATQPPHQGSLFPGPSQTEGCRGPQTSAMRCLICSMCSRCRSRFFISCRARPASLAAPLYCAMVVSGAGVSDQGWWGRGKHLGLGGQRQGPALRGDQGWPGGPRQLGNP